MSRSLTVTFNEIITMVGRKHGQSFGEIARFLGISRQRVHQIWKSLKPN